MGANFKRDETYYANVTMRSRMTLLPEMKKKLEGTRRDALLRDTCFGNWLDILHWRLEGHLVHLIMQMQVDLGEMHDPVVDPLIYEVGGHRLEFGPKQFCLITGLRFGTIDLVKYKAKTIPFRHRVFGHVKTESIHIDDIQKVYEGPDFATLTDLDAVRVCLLMVLELVFLGAGGDMQHVVDPDYLELVEDLNEWNCFPWGSHLWLTTHAQLKDAVPIRRTKHLRQVKQSPAKKPHYTLMGFIWAFKIWILETFPICREWWLPREDMLPRGIRWYKNVTFNRCNHYLFTGPFNPPNIPRQTLALLPAEAHTDWWIASRDFFEVQVEDVVPPPPPGPRRRRKSVAQHIQRDDGATSVAVPPLTPSTSPPTQDPSLEERFLKLQRDHSVLQNGNRDLHAFCCQLHQRCLSLEQKVFSTNHKQDGRVIPYRPPPAGQENPVPKRRARAQEQPQPLPEPIYMQEQPSLFDIMAGIQGLQERHDEFAYRLSGLEYRTDWNQHNNERFYAHQQGFQPTPYHPPPYWGTPEVVYPHPQYDREVALAELQRQQ